VYNYKVLDGTAPRSLEEFVVAYQPTWSLMSESELLLTVPKKTTLGVIYGNRFFRKIAVNRLLTIRKWKTPDTFKKKKKIKNYFYLGLSHLNKLYI